MGEVDLLDGFTFGSSANVPLPPDDSNEYFSQNFWGEKNQGFGVLYRNMKHGQGSVKALQDFIKESANAEDLYAKHLSKLASKAVTSGNLGTFSPLFENFKVMAEKLSSCHTDIVHKLNEIIKELSKYLEEQHSNHRLVKTEVRGTADAIQQIQNVTLQAQRSKEKYHQLCSEAERMKRSNALPKDVEKMELKSKKAAEEYKIFVEKYANVKTEYECKMTESSKRFQEIEEAHLKHMKSVLDSYILSFENINVLAKQVHQEFRRQCDERTIESLIKRYSESRGTGTEKPELITFEKFDVSSVPVSPEPILNMINTEEGFISPTVKAVMQLNPFRRMRRSKNSKDNHSTKDAEKNGNSVKNSPEREVVPEVDAEGYTIRPEQSKEPKSGSWGFDSSDDDSDSDDEGFRTRKIRVQIKDKTTVDSKSDNLDALNAITRNLILSSPVAVRGNKSFPVTENNQVDSTTEKSTKFTDSEILELFDNSGSRPAARSNSNSDMSDFFMDNKPKSSTSHQYSSNVSLNNLFIMSSDNESVKRSDSPSHSPDIFNDFSVPPTTRPNNLSLSDAWNEPHKGRSMMPFSSHENWSSLSPITASPMDSLSSRGSSPLTFAQSDPIPIAVALNETVNANFKGPAGERCVAQISGEVQMSFPAAVVKNLTSISNSPTLSFRLKKTSKIQDFIPNSKILFIDSSQSNSSQRSFWFDMPSLKTHIKNMMDTSPNSPYYNIQILSYQMTSQTGHGLVPLHLSSTWKLETDSTEVVVDYKYNSDVSSCQLKNVQVIVPVDGEVTSAQSEPTAAWNAAQNRLLWSLTSAISPSSPSGTLKSKLTLLSGPSKSTTLAAQFLSEGGTLTGTDFDLTGSGYRVTLVKKKFISGRYLLNGN